VVYHEYTHGLSNRLVVDANGLSTLGDVEAGAMARRGATGTPWTTWSARACSRTPRRSATSGSASTSPRRHDPQRAAGLPGRHHVDGLPGTAAAGPGGYTYGDYARISARGAEVHRDGEIWAQTLWDLRKAIGSKKAESLVTRAMELSPSNPSFLDERNSILQGRPGRRRRQAAEDDLADVRRPRMGFFAAATDGDDASRSRTSRCRRPRTRRAARSPEPSTTRTPARRSPA